MAPNWGQGLTLDIVSLEKKKAQLKLLIGDVQSQALTSELEMLRSIPFSSNYNEKC
jgi:hypothetical protein